MSDPVRHCSLRRNPKNARDVPNLPCHGFAFVRQELLGARMVYAYCRRVIAVKPLSGRCCLSVLPLAGGRLLSGMTMAFANPRSWMGIKGHQVVPMKQVAGASAQRPLP